MVVLTRMGTFKLTLLLDSIDGERGRLVEERQAAFVRQLGVLQTDSALIAQDYVTLPSTGGKGKKSCLPQTDV